MKINQMLLPRSAWIRPIMLIWDSDAGSIAGPDALMIKKMADYYSSTGVPVPHRLPPDGISIQDPLHSPEDMAMLLGASWYLPPELEEVYPRIDDDTEDGAVN